MLGLRPLKLEVFLSSGKPLSRTTQACKEVRNALEAQSQTGPGVAGRKEIREKEREREGGREGERGREKETERERERETKTKRKRE